MVDVVVIGGANMDIKAKCASPMVARTSNIGEVQTRPGGVGRNIAHNLARLGLRVKLLSAFGRDAHGDAVEAATRAAGVDTSLCLRSSANTGTYLAVLDADGELVTAINDMRIMEGISPALVQQASAALEQARLVIADCNPPVETLRAVATLARHKLVVEPVSVPKAAKLLAMLQDGPVFLATPNRDQLQALTATRDIAQGTARLLALGLQCAVVHDGPAGAHVADGASLLHVPPQPAKVEDVTGAGDAAVAGLVAGLLDNLSLTDAARRGQVLAARVAASAASTLE